MGSLAALIKETLKSFIKLILGRGSLRSYSQFGEDAILISLLKNCKNGTYIDVGAYHPVLYSNTYALYRRGWKGIAVDPNPEMKQLFSIFRPRDKFLQVAIGEDGQMLAYHRYADGAYNTLSDAHASSLAEKNIHPLSQSEVKVESLTGIVARSGFKEIHLLSIDVEGMDTEVLKSYDWSIRPAVVVIEAHGFEPDQPMDNPTYQFMRGKGYRLVGKAGLSLIFKIEK